MGEESSAVATWLHDAGYRTALFGKYLNGYSDALGGTYVPPGWDAWYAWSADGKVHENGTLISHNGEHPDYVVADKAVAFVDSSQDSFFAYVAPHAAHVGGESAQRHANLFPDLWLPRGLSFDEQNVRDKPQWVRDAPYLTSSRLAKMESLYRYRARSMQAVDEMTERLIAALEAKGELGNTYVFFASDNGFHMGEHGLTQGKDNRLEAPKGCSGEVRRTAEEAP